MTNLFTAILNMSITASYVALAVILMRIPLKKVPRIFSYIMWLPVWLRLILPISFTSGFSFLRILRPGIGTRSGTMEYIPQNIGLMQKPAIDAGFAGINKAVNTSLPAAVPVASANPMQLMLYTAGVIWISGIVILLAYSIISYIRVRKNIETATLIEEEIYESDRITTPFVFGFIKPKIYIPAGLNESELSFILAHERTHIRRKDHLIKPIAFLTLIIHWFNPLMWLSFILMSKDMEMSCDENVLRKLGNDIKTSYANSLLSFSVKRSGLLAGSPLAFGESSIKSRIKNIMAFKKPAFWIVAVMVLVIAVSMAAFVSNPGNKKSSESAPLPSGNENTSQKTALLYGYDVKTLLADKTPYVGDNSKVVHLVDAMPLPGGISRDALELQTGNKPYGIVVNLKMSDASGVSKDGAISGDAFYRNSILLFSLIDNVDQISWRISDNTGKYNGARYTFTYTREMSDKLIGEDVRQYSKSKDTLESFINRLSGMAFSDKPSYDKIEKYLETIMSPPGTSSNPQDYIKAHWKEYESIIKMGDVALNYLLGQFEKGGNNNLRGYIMMALCKDLLGDRNNVTEEGLLPEEWFSRLSPYKETSLPDFKGDFPDKVEQLVYDAAMKKYSNSSDGFTIVAPTIFGSYEEGNKLKVFVTVFSSRYKLYGKTLSEGGGSIVPAAITFTKNADGSYTLDKYLEAMDGSYFSKSIKEYCVMPVSKKEIKGLYNKIMEDCGNNKDRSELMRKNLIEHLKSYNQKDIFLKQLTGELVQLT